MQSSLHPEHFLVYSLNGSAHFIFYSIIVSSKYENLSFAFYLVAKICFFFLKNLYPFRAILQPSQWCSTDLLMLWCFSERQLSLQFLDSNLSFFGRLPFTLVPPGGKLLSTPNWVQLIFFYLIRNKIWGCNFELVIRFFFIV